MTAVTIRPTFKKDSRPNNGLEAIAGQLQADKTKVFRVVGLVKYAGASVSEDGEITPAAKFVSLEVVSEDAGTVDALIDERRKARGLGIAGDIPVTGQLAGQGAFDFEGTDEDDEPQMRVGPDGPREVPPADGAEIMAEREETKRTRRAKPSTAPFTPDGEA